MSNYDSVLSEIKSDTYLKNVFNSLDESSKDAKGYYSIIFKNAIPNKTKAILTKLGAKPKGSEKLGVWSIASNTADVIVKQLKIEPTIPTETETETETETKTKTKTKVIRLVLKKKEENKKEKLVSDTFAKIYGGNPIYDSTAVHVPMPMIDETKLKKFPLEFQRHMQSLNNTATIIAQSFNTQSDLLKEIMEITELFTPEDMDKVRRITNSMVSFASMQKEEILYGNKIIGALSATGLIKSTIEMEEIITKRLDDAFVSNSQKKLPKMDTSTYITAFVRMISNEISAMIQKKQETGENIDYDCFDELAKLKLFPDNNGEFSFLMKALRVMCESNDSDTISLFVAGLKGILLKYTNEAIENNIFNGSDGNHIISLVEELYSFFEITKISSVKSSIITGFLDDATNAVVRLWNYFRLLFALFMFMSILLTIIGIDPTDLFNLVFGSDDAMTSSIVQRHEVASKLQLVKTDFTKLREEMNKARTSYNNKDLVNDARLFYEENGLIDWEYLYEQIDVTNEVIDKAVEPVKDKFIQEQQRVDKATTGVSIDVYSNIESRGKSMTRLLNTIEDPVIQESFIREAAIASGVPNVTNLLQGMNFGATQGVSTLQGFIEKDLNISVAEPWTSDVLDRIVQSASVVTGSAATEFIGKTGKTITDWIATNTSESFNQNGNPVINQLFNGMASKVGDVMSAVRTKSSSSNEILNSKEMFDCAINHVKQYSTALAAPFASTPTYNKLIKFHDNLINEIEISLSESATKLTSSLLQGGEQIGYMGDVIHNYKDYFKVFASRIPTIYFADRFIGRFTNFVRPNFINPLSIPENVTNSLNTISSLNAGLGVSFSTILAEQLGFGIGNETMAAFLKSTFIGWGGLHAQSMLNTLHAYSRNHPDVDGLSSLLGDILPYLLLNTIVLNRAHFFKLIRGVIYNIKVFRESSKRMFVKQISTVMEKTLKESIAANPSVLNEFEEKKRLANLKERTMRANMSQSTGMKLHIEKIIAWFSKNVIQNGVDISMGLVDMYADAASRFYMLIGGMNIAYESAVVVAKSVSLLAQLGLYIIPKSVYDIGSIYTATGHITMEIIKGSDISLLTSSNFIKGGIFAMANGTGLILGVLYGIPTIWKLLKATPQIYEGTKDFGKGVLDFASKVWLDIYMTWAFYLPVIATRGFCDEILGLDKTAISKFAKNYEDWEKNRNPVSQLFDADLKLSEDLSVLGDTEFEERKVLAVFSIIKSSYHLGVNTLLHFLGKGIWNSYIKKGSVTLLRDKHEAINYFLQKDTERLAWLNKYDTANMQEMIESIEKKTLPPVIDPYFLRKVYFLFDTMSKTNGALIQKGAENLQKMASAFADFLTEGEIQKVNKLVDQFLIA